jgi:hypothetical protein
MSAKIMPDRFVEMVLSVWKCFCPILNNYYPFTDIARYRSEFAKGRGGVQSRLITEGFGGISQISQMCLHSE